jgi:hypothetical protein
LDRSVALEMVSKLPYSQKVNFIISYLVTQLCENAVFIVGFLAARLVNYLYYTDRKDGVDKSSLPIFQDDSGATFSRFGKSMLAIFGGSMLFLMMISSGLWLMYPYFKTSEMKWFLIGSKFVVKTLFCAIVSILILSKQFLLLAATPKLN